MHANRSGPPTKQWHGQRERGCNWSNRKPCCLQAMDGCWSRTGKSTYWLLITNRFSYKLFPFTSWAEHSMPKQIPETWFRLVSHNLFYGQSFPGCMSELLVLDTRNCASDDVVNTIRTIEKLGNSQYQNYVKDVLVQGKTSIHSSTSSLQEC